MSALPGRRARRLRSHGEEAYRREIANIPGYIGHNGAAAEENAALVTFVDRAAPESGEAEGITFTFARYLYPGRFPAPAGGMLAGGLPAWAPSASRSPQFTTPTLAPLCSLR